MQGVYPSHGSREGDVLKRTSCAACSYAFPFRVSAQAQCSQGEPVKDFPARQQFEFAGTGTWQAMTHRNWQSVVQREHPLRASRGTPWRRGTSVPGRPCCILSPHASRSQGDDSFVWTVSGDREHPVKAFNNYSSNLYGFRDQLQAVISPATVQSSPSWPDEWLATVLCKSPNGATAGCALPRRGVGSSSVNQQRDTKKHGGAPFYWTGCPLDVWRLCRTPSTESLASAMPLSLTG